MKHKNELLDYIEEWKYCPVCGEKLKPEFEEVINSTLMCKNKLCVCKVKINR